MNPIRTHSDALLVADLQYDFLPNGALAVPGSGEIVSPIAALCHRFFTVVAVQDFHPSGHVSFASSHPGRRPFETTVLPNGCTQELWPDHCVRGTRGAALHPELPDARLTLVLRKGMRRETDSYSAFREQPGSDGRRASTGLGPMLNARGIERVFVVGLARDFCVRASAIDAADAGFDVVVLEDLTRPVSEGYRCADDPGFVHPRIEVSSSSELPA